MKSKIYIVLFMLVVLYSATVVAQKKKAVIAPASLQAIGRVDSVNKHIKLRWAPDNVKLWQQGNKYGYKLIRYTVLKNNKLETKPQAKILAEKLLPKPLQEWETLAEKDENAGVIAQAIYGDDFETSVTGGKQDMKTIMNKADEQEQRLAFALYAADMSYQAARYAALGYTDTDIKEDERYLYLVIIQAPDKKDSTSVLIGYKDYRPLPYVEEVAADFGDKQVKLSWDYERYLKYFVSYYIERSPGEEDNYKRINEQPYISGNDIDGKKGKHVFYLDSLPDNQHTYAYRIRGVDAFGEIAPPSPAVKGKGKDNMLFVPYISKGYVSKDKKLHIAWEFEKAGEPFINKFVLYRADKESGPFKIFADNIKVTDRELESSAPLSNSNYFILHARTKEGNMQKSHPFFVQVVDSVPPAIPSGLKAVVDKKGVVTLTWNKNTEKDLKGYKIFRALTQNEEFVAVTDSVYTATTIKDSLSMSLSNKKAWYVVVSIDQRFNQSLPCKPVEVKKPLKMQPIPAAFKNYGAQTNGVNLQWHPSPDKDVTHTLLYRKAKTEKQDSLLKIFTDTTSLFLNTDIKENTVYSYFLQVKNEDGLTSSSDTIKIATGNFIPFNTKIENLQLYPDIKQKHIKLVWHDSFKKVAEYKVYKAKKGEPLTLWKTTLAKTLIDKDIQPGTEYIYAVMAEFENGIYSQSIKEMVKY